MDAPPIQYCRTADGVNIAYWTLGAGPPLVHAPFSPSDLLAEWEVPQWREWYLRLARTHTVTKFDRRGAGLSQRDCTDFSLPALIHDVAAIADVSGEGPVDLLGVFASAPPVLGYAAHFPERVRRLVLVNAYASGADGLSVPAPRTLRRTIDEDWETATGLFAIVGGASGVDAELLADAWRKSTTREEYTAFVAAVAHHDASDLLPAIEAPTLVLHPTESQFHTLSMAQRLAGTIPNARLQTTTSGFYPFLGDAAPVLQLIEDFLDEGEPAPDTGAPAPGLRTLLFTDLESSTALTQSLGDAKAQEVLHGHNAAVRAALATHNGTEVKHTGDGIFAAFGSAVSAVEAALQIQRDLAAAEVRVRIGLNAGEPIAEDDDYFGTAVQLAARVCDRAEPGQVLVSRVVHDLCAGKGFAFTDQGEATLKGFPEPVRLFVVGEGT